MSTRKPKVAIVTPGTFTVPSDRSSSVEHIVEQTSQKLKARVTPLIFSRKTRRLPVCETIDGITHIRPPAGTRRAYRQAVYRWLRKIEPDLIQIENRPHLVHGIKKRNRRIPVWLMLHSITYLSRTHISPKRLRKNLAATDKIVVNSVFMQNEVMRRYPKCRNKILVCYPGTDPARFTSIWEEPARTVRHELRRKLGVADRSIVLYAGRLKRMKGVHHLLNIWRKVIERHPQALLLVVGSAFYGKKTKTAYVRQLHRQAEAFSKHIRFIPYVPYNEMPQWYQVADVAVVPSLDKEAFGLVNVEAMACGIPVIASRSGGISEIVEHGVNGYLVEAGNKENELLMRICELLDQQELRSRMGINGVQTVRERFTWAHAANRLLACYEGYSPIFRRAGDDHRDR